MQLAPSLAIGWTDDILNHVETAVVSVADVGLEAEEIVRIAWKRRSCIYVWFYLRKRGVQTGLFMVNLMPTRSRNQFSGVAEQMAETIKQMQVT